MHCPDVLTHVRFSFFPPACSNLHDIYLDVFLRFFSEEQNQHISAVVVWWHKEKFLEKRGKEK